MNIRGQRVSEIVSLSIVLSCLALLTAYDKGDVLRCVNENDINILLLFSFFLLVSRLETPIESLDDLSEQFKVQYAPMNGSTAMIYFKRMAHIEQRFYE